MREMLDKFLKSAGAALSSKPIDKSQPDPEYTFGATIDDYGKIEHYVTKTQIVLKDPKAGVNEESEKSFKTVENLGPKPIFSEQGSVFGKPSADVDSPVAKTLSDNSKSPAKR
jgi:hypothetical protein